MSIEIIKPNTESSVRLPLADGIRAGFPSPAQDYVEASIDLNQELIAHPSSTFYGRVKGYSMIDAGVDDGDIIVIDKSLEPQNGDMAVCFIDGEFTLKFIDLRDDGMWLQPANKDFPPIKVYEGSNFEVWGIVTYTIKKRH